MTLRVLNGEEVPDCCVLGMSSRKGYPNLYHVAILLDSLPSLSDGEDCAAYDCGPPVGPMIGGFKYVGYIESLTVRERNTIQTTAPLLEAEVLSYGLTENDQYIIDPPIKEVRDPITNRVRSVRYSCSGFAMQCYRTASIDLVDLHTLPSVTLAELKVHNPALRRVDESDLAELGLGGSGPWEICFAGYVLRAFDRADTDIRTPLVVTSLEEAHISI